MKATLHYSEKMTLCIHGLGVTATIDFGCISLERALEYTRAIFDNKTLFNGDSIESVHIINSETGELIAECEPDQPSKELDDDGWTMYDAIDVADLEMGFNPYEGCYDYDC